jgi:amino acid adenylation domain-containing protein
MTDQKNHSLVLYNTSPTQRNLWSRQMLAGKTFFSHGFIRWNGALDHDRLINGLKQLVEKHDTLRAIYPHTGLHSYPQFGISAAAEIVTRILRSKHRKVGDLLNVVGERTCDPATLELPCILLTLVEHSPDEHTVVLSVPCLNADTVSIRNLLTSLLQFYHSGSLPVISIRISFARFSQWLNKMTSASDEGKQFWSKYPVQRDKFELPFSRTGKTIRNIQVIGFSLGKDIRDRSEKLAAAIDVPLNIIYFTCLVFLMSRYTGKREVELGNSFDGREVEELNNLTGQIACTLPLSLEIDGHESFEQLLQKVMLRWMEVNNLKEHFPFDEYRSSRVSFEFVDVSNMMTVAGSSVSSVCFANDADESKLKVICIYGAQSVEIEWIYDDSFVSVTAVEIMQSQYSDVLTGVLANVGVRLDSVMKVTRFNQSKLATFSKQKVFESSAGILECFQQCVNEHGNCTAVVYGDRRISFKELDKMSNLLAGVMLSQHKIVEEDIVCLCLSRSEKIVISILAVLKCGAAFLPIDPSTPIKRKEYILNDSNARLVVADEKVNTAEMPPTIELLMVEKIITEEYSAVELPKPYSRRAERIAYVIYTSGSTGRPKGVTVSDKSVANYAGWISRELSLSSTDSSILLTSFAFDLAYTNIWACIFWGTTLHVIDEDLLHSPENVLEYINRHQVTYLKSTPTLISTLVDPLRKTSDVNLIKSLRLVIVGGEKIRVNDLRVFFDRNESMEFIDEYGPTETTIGCVAQRITKQTACEFEDRCIVGRPIDNCGVYILDDDRNVCPVGIIGEIYVGGATLALGYLNDPELTNASFVDDVIGSTRLYKTGDQGRWLENGSIEFCGRWDFQLKVNGYRVELEEIRSELCRLEDVQDAFVIIDPEADGSLLAFVVSQRSDSVNKIGKELSNVLPRYMIPTVIVPVPNLHFTANGKVDTRLLLELRKSFIAAFQYEPPQTETEAQIAGVWEKVLRRTSIGRNHNFFSLSGDSIKAIQSVSLINQHFNTSIQVSDIYRNQHLHSLAALLDKSVYDVKRSKQLEQATAEINKVRSDVLAVEHNRSVLASDLEDIYPMSDVELGMIYHTLAQPDSRIYVDQNYAEIVDSDFAPDRFIKAIHLLVEKHPVLRTRYYLQKFGRPVKVVGTQIDDTIISFHKLTSMSPGNRNTHINDQMAVFRAEIVRRLQMDGFIWRLAIYDKGDGKFGIVWVHHHALVDGWSSASFLTELGNVYLQLKKDALYKPEPLKASYKDFLVDQYYHNNLVDSNSFWKENLNGYKRIELPFKRRTSENRSFKYLSRPIQPAVCQGVEVFSKHSSVSVKSIALAAFTYLLKLATGTSDITFGIVSHGRPEIEDGDKILGCFLNRIPFRVNTLQSLRPVDLIEVVNQSFMDSQPHSKLSYPTILKNAGWDSKVQGPFFNLSFNFIDFFIYKDLDEGVTVNEEASSVIDVHEYNEIDFDFVINKINNNLFCSVNYISETYCASEIETFIEYYDRVLEYFVKHSYDTLSASAVFSTEELNWIDTTSGNAPGALLQYDQLTVDDLKTLRSFWAPRLLHVSPVIFRKPANKIQFGRGVLTRDFPPAIIKQLSGICSKSGYSEEVVLQAIFKILVYRYSGNNEFIIARTIKLTSFINLLISIVSFDDNDTFERVFAREQANNEIERDHSHFPFDYIGEIASSARKENLAGIVFSFGEDVNATSQADLIFRIRQAKEHNSISIEYSVSAFTPGILEVMVEHFFGLIATAGTSANERLKQRGLLSNKELDTILRMSVISYDNDDTTVLDLFERHVKSNPNSIAVVSHKETLTYQQLDEKTSKLAMRLIEMGVISETLVPVLMKPGARLTIAVIGILKAGGVYVPIDVDVPDQRLALMLDDMNSKIIVTEAQAYSGRVTKGFALVYLDNLEIWETNTSFIKTKITKPGDLAFVIYTSGSTGKPKGVMVEHRNLKNYLVNEKTKYLDDNSDGGTYYYLPNTFDASVTALLMPLVFGKKVVFGDKPPSQAFGDELFKKHAPYDFLKCTPAHLPLLEYAVKDGEVLFKRLVVGGETLFTRQLRPLKEKGVIAEIVNEYGPTETTVGCTVYKINEADLNDLTALPIGKAIDHTSIYILENGTLHPAAHGTTGEIVVGGSGVARGYLNDPEKTFEKFIRDPVTGTGIAYTTGDMGYETEDGVLQFVGRNDHQAKVRGVRIETSEIEAILLQSDLVVACAVIVDETDVDNKLLMCHIVPGKGFNDTILELYLKSSLPAYMIPDKIVKWDAFPLSVHGKVDRKLLTKREETLERIVISPRNDTDETIRSIWGQVLHLDAEQISIKDNFFKLRGHSIHVLRVLAGISEKLMISVPINTFFGFNSLADLSDYIQLMQVKSPSERTGVDVSDL